MSALRVSLRAAEALVRSGAAVEGVRVAVNADRSVRVLDRLPEPLPVALWQALRRPPEDPSPVAEDPLPVAEDPLLVAEWPERVRLVVHVMQLPLPHALPAPAGRSIVYWTRCCFRVQDNLALRLARLLAARLGLPLLVLALVDEDAYALGTQPRTEAPSLRRQSASLLAALSCFVAALRSEGVAVEAQLVHGTSLHAALLRLVRDRCPAYALVCDDLLAPGGAAPLHALAAHLPALPILLADASAVLSPRLAPLGCSRDTHAAMLHAALLAPDDPPLSIVHVAAPVLCESYEVRLLDCVATRAQLAEEGADWLTEELATRATDSPSPEPPLLLALVRAGVLSAYRAMARVHAEGRGWLGARLAEEQFALLVCLQRCLDPRLGWTGLLPPDGLPLARPGAAMFPRPVLTGSTEDEAFNRAQRALVCAGELPEGALRPWLAFLLRALPSPRMGLTHALLELACHLRVRSDGLSARLALEALDILEHPSHP